MPNQAATSSSSSAQAVSLLKKHGMSVTQSRVGILEAFLQVGSALEHADLEKRMGTADRVTIYRTLQSFVDKGLLHVVPTTDNSIRYALCKANCAEGHHHDNHVHFACNTCNVTYCLDDVVQPIISLPPGFKAAQTDLVVKGICNMCHTA